MTEAEAYDNPANGYRASKTFAVGKADTQPWQLD